MSNIVAVHNALRYVSGMQHLVGHNGMVAAGLSRAPTTNRAAPFCPIQLAVCLLRTKVKVVLRPLTATIAATPCSLAILSHWPCVADCHGRRLTSMPFAIFLMKTWLNKWAIMEYERINIDKYLLVYVRMCVWVLLRCERGAPRVRFSIFISLCRKLSKDKI